jgi:hypothetical protein
MNISTCRSDCWLWWSDQAARTNIHPLQAKRAQPARAPRFAPPHASHFAQQSRHAPGQRLGVRAQAHGIEAWRTKPARVEGEAMRTLRAVLHLGFEVSIPDPDRPHSLKAASAGRFRQSICFSPRSPGREPSSQAGARTPGAQRGLSARQTTLRLREAPERAPMLARRDLLCSMAILSGNGWRSRGRLMVSCRPLSHESTRGRIHSRS